MEASLLGGCGVTGVVVVPFVVLAVGWSAALGAVGLVVAWVGPRWLEGPLSGVGGAVVAAA